MDTIRVKFPGEPVREVPLDEICMVVGRGIWGRDALIQAAKAMGDSCFMASERHADGTIMLDSSHWSAADEARELRYSVTTDEGKIIAEDVDLEAAKAAAKKYLEPWCATEQADRLGYWKTGGNLIVEVVPKVGDSLDWHAVIRPIAKVEAGTT